MERSTAKNYLSVSLLSVIKVFEKLVDNRIADHLEKCGFFLISSMFLGLLDQLQIFWQFYLIELLGLLTDLELLELLHLIYPRLSTGFDMLIFFINLSLIEIQVRSLPFCCLFSVIDVFRWFWMGSVQNNVQLVLEFLKILFLVLRFSYYTLMTFLKMLSVTLPSLLMILLSTLSAMRHLICGNSCKWLLHLNLIYEKLWTVVTSDLLISLLGNLNCFHLIDLKTLVLLMWKWWSFKMLGLTFFPKLDWDSYIIPITKTTSKKIGALPCFLENWKNKKNWSLDSSISFFWGCSVSK